MVLEDLADRFPRLRKVWADGGYAGQLLEKAKDWGKWVLEIVKRSDKAEGFELLPHRWIVERTFGWLGRYRRLSKDYEVFTVPTFILFKNGKVFWRKNGIAPVHEILEHLNLLME